MTQNYRDPVAYLNEAVSKRGKSGPDGVYLHNVTVVADCFMDHNYKTSVDPITPLIPPAGITFDSWAYLLINSRVEHRALEFSLEARDFIFQFLPEGNQLSMNVFAPRVDIESFSYLIISSQEMLKCVADFAGKVATTVRFNIGVATKTWDDMVESGDAQEMEYSF